MLELHSKGDNRLSEQYKSDNNRKLLFQMLPKNYSLVELKTLLQNTQDQVQQILLNPSAHNNEQYFENFTTISLRTIKYINHYLNKINFDQHIGEIIDKIISGMNESLTEYKGRNIFTSCGVMSPLAVEEDSLDKDEDQIYHFMNTRNKSIPLECLGNPDLERQRIQLAEFVQSMEKKKTTFKQSKRSLELPIQTSKKLKAMRKATYDPSLTPILQEDHGYFHQRSHAISQVNSRQSEEAETQTDGVKLQFQKQTQKQQCQLKSQAESMFVSQNGESKTNLDKNQEEEQLKKLKEQTIPKKKSNRKIDGKGNKKKKKAKILDYTFYSREGSRKGIKLPEENQVKDKEQIKQCSVKMLKSISQNLSLTSKEIEIAISNVLNFSNTVSRICQQGQNGREGSAQAEQMLEGPPNIQNNVKFQEMDWTNSKYIDQNNSLDKIKQMQEEQSVLISQQNSYVQSNSKVNSPPNLLIPFRGESPSKNSRQSSQKKSSLIKNLENSNQQMIAVRNIQYTEESSNSNIGETITINQIHNKKMNNKRLTIFNVKLGSSPQGQMPADGNINFIRASQINNQATEEGHSNASEYNKRQYKQSESQKMQKAQKQINVVQNLIEQDNRASETLSQNMEDLLPYYQRQRQRKLLTINQGERSRSKKKSTDKGQSQNIRNKRYAATDTFSQFLGNNLKKQQEEQKRGSTNSDPMIKILTKEKFQQIKSNLKIAEQEKSSVALSSFKQVNSKLKIERNGNNLSPISLKQSQKLNQVLIDKFNRKHTSILFRNHIEKDCLPYESYSSGSPNKKGHSSQHACPSNTLLSTSPAPFKSSLSTLAFDQTAKKEKQYKKIAESLNSNLSDGDIQELLRQLRYKQRRQVFNQYLQLVELTHLKFCGKNCQHLSHLFKKSNEDKTQVDETMIDQLLRLLKKSNQNRRPN